MNSRRQAFALAAALTATALTSAVALAGFTHHPTGGSKPQTPPVQIASPAPTPAEHGPSQHWEDD
jgi:hypothetical protein